MNFLAHLWLADVAGASLPGAVLGDLVHGPIGDDLPADLALSIRLHRRVDVETDRHPQVLAAKARFPQGDRRYAGILLDMLYDHWLARHWADCSAEPLEVFTRRAAIEVAHCKAGFAAVGRSPPPAGSFAELLQSYRTQTGMERAIARIAQRLSRPEPFLKSAVGWRSYYGLMEADALVVLEALKQAAIDFMRHPPAARP